MQMGLDDDVPYTPTINREKAKEIFKFVEDQKFKTMENLAKNPAAQGDQQ